MKTTLYIMRHVRLLAPEPDATGSGGGDTPPTPTPAEPAPAGGESAPDPTPAAPTPEGSFWDDDSGDSESPDDGTPPVEPAPEWVAEYGEEVQFANDEQRAIIDGIGKEAGLDPKQYAAVIGKLDALMREQQQTYEAQLQEHTRAALKKAWGADFEAKSKQARGAYGALAQELGMSTDELKAQIPATPASVQLLQRYAQAISGSSASIEGQGANKPWFGDESNELYKAFMNPSHPRYEEAHKQRLSDLSTQQ